MSRLRAWARNAPCPEVWAVRLHRMAHGLWVRGHPTAAQWLQTLGRVLTGVDIDPAARMGPGLEISHGVGLVVGPDVVTGPSCVLRQCVTLGGNGRVKGMPHLGARVQVGANAVLLGPITVGDDAWIGAGAVVLCDVPAGCVAVGNPARVLPPKSERAQIQVPRGAGGGAQAPLSVPARHSSRIRQ